MAADALDRSGVRQALDGIDTAYYLIHSLGTGASFEQPDRQSARMFADAARDAGVDGWLTSAGSPRARPGSCRRTCAREARSVRSCSAAGCRPPRFRRGDPGQRVGVVRDAALPDRTAAHDGDAEVGGTRIQPIAVRDVLRYLVGAAALPAEVNRRFDIGGPDILTYPQMMRRYATMAGLPPRILLRVPVLTFSFSTHWVGLVTPVPRGLAKPLVESLRNEVWRPSTIRRVFPDPPGGLLPGSGGQAGPPAHPRR